MAEDEHQSVTLEADGRAFAEVHTERLRGRVTGTMPPGTRGGRVADTIWAPGSGGAVSCAGRLVGGGAAHPAGITPPEIAHVAPRLADVRASAAG